MRNDQRLFSAIFFLTLPETNSSPLKMDGWNTTFLLGRPIFRGYVSFREGKLAGQIFVAKTFAIGSSTSMSIVCW